MESSTRSSDMATSSSSSCDDDCGSRRSRIRKLLKEEVAFRQCPDQVALESSVKPLWRNRVAQWYYDVVDHLEIPREVVYWAMSFLDRGTATSDHQPMTQEQYEITSTTALFLAIRIATKSELKIADLLDLCGSRLTVRQVQANGSCLLQTLSLQTPLVSPFSLAQAYLSFLQKEEDDVMETVTFFLELSVCDHSLAGIPASKLAYCAVSLCVTPTSELSDITHISLEDPEVQETCDRMRRIYRQSLTGSADPQPLPTLIVDDEEDEEDATQSKDSFQSLMHLLPWTPSSMDLAACLPKTTTTPSALSKNNNNMMKRNTSSSTSSLSSKNTNNKRRRLV
mmetsp:Transcript_42894/g.123997  ORF Transcript_42894/g.123997 Transcript_42894/m.123997 type:complete len:339 (-) Transcript_42894:396-1412(-)